MDKRILQEYGELKDRIKKYIIKLYAADGYIHIHIKMDIYFKYWKEINNILYKYPEDVLFNSPVKNENGILLITGNLKGV